MLDIDPRTEEQQKWETEKSEMDLDPFYWEWLDQVERQLDRDLGEDNDR